ncbi:hypothetical protein J3R83DRAFT_5539 [Lanmaoa asiatica]|nr:hypothetical protein J3R83DRAFT_5539 [Lanmaoa asiatica]
MLATSPTSPSSTSTHYTAPHTSFLPTARKEYHVKSNLTSHTTYSVDAMSAST